MSLSFTVSEILNLFGVSDCLWPYNLIRTLKLVRPVGLDSFAFAAIETKFKCKIYSSKIPQFYLKSKFRTSVPVFFSVLAHTSCVPSFERIRQSGVCRRSSDLSKV